jgi:hypothetical protein
MPIGPGPGSKRPVDNRLISAGTRTRLTCDADGPGSSHRSLVDGTPRWSLPWAGNLGAASGPGIKSSAGHRHSWGVAGRAVDNETGVASGPRIQPTVRDRQFRTLDRSLWTTSRGVDNPPELSVPCRSVVRGGQRPRRVITEDNPPGRRCRTLVGCRGLMRRGACLGCLPGGPAASPTSNHGRPAFRRSSAVPCGGSGSARTVRCPAPAASCGGSA